MGFKIPLIKPNVGAEELEAVKRVFDSGILTQGEETQKFEEDVAEFVGSKYAIATTSCTTSLFLALTALGISAGDEVIVPDFTFPASANAVIACGATPVLCDIRLSEFQIDPEKIKPLINGKTKAIMPVDEFGLTADMKAIMDIAEDNELAVVEDAAPALGSRRWGKHAGTFGDAGCFSFHPRKLCTIGEGGMIVTDDQLLAEHIRMLRNHGLHQGEFVSNALNFRLSNVQAAIGRVQLEKLPENILVRRETAKIYNDVFADNGIQIPYVPKDCFHTYQSYVLLLKEAEKIRAKMRSEGEIEVQIGTYALHQHPAFNTCPTYGDTLHYSTVAREHGMAIPLYTSMGWYNEMKVVEEVLKEVGKFK